jgi:predicted AAA+ superfamily ATPase
VAHALVPANEIVLIGHGIGKSSAVEVLADYLKKHHPEISRLVKATETADLSSLTDAQAEAIAKKHMITVV